jgi:hypothetical protein
MNHQYNHCLWRLNTTMIQKQHKILFSLVNSKALVHFDRPFSFIFILTEKKIFLIRFHIIATLLFSLLQETLL